MVKGFFMYFCSIKLKIKRDDRLIEISNKVLINWFFKW